MLHQLGPDLAVSLHDLADQFRCRDRFFEFAWCAGRAGDEYAPCFLPYPLQIRNRTRQNDLAWTGELTALDLDHVLIPELLQGAEAGGEIECARTSSTRVFSATCTCLVQAPALASAR